MAQRLGLSCAMKYGTRAHTAVVSDTLVVGGSQFVRHQQQQNHHRRTFLTTSQDLQITRRRPSSREENLPQHGQVRHSSHSPMGTAVNDRKKVTIETLRKMHSKKDPITMITAHDFPSAHVADHAGMDMILVGDSLAMVALGMEDTSEVLMEEMILHCRSVARATKAAFTVGDLPMGSYEISPEQGLESSIRLIKEGRVQSVKLEGGVEMAPTIRKISQAGIPVLAHIGLTPQRQNSLGGFRVQGKTVDSAVKLLEDALAVQDAGAFGVVLEAVPEQLARIITTNLMIPTIGIGAGKYCSGQVLVQVDMLGNFPPGRFIPKFVKKYGDVWGESLRAIQAYKEDVKTAQYPALEHTYPVSEDMQKQIVHRIAEISRAIQNSMEEKLMDEETWTSMSTESKRAWQSRYRSSVAKCFRDGSLKLYDS